MAAIISILRVPKSGGIGTTKVRLVRWLKLEGDRVRRGEAVVELETEKVNYELDSPFEGVMVKILAQETDEVPVGDPLCQIEQSSDESTNRPGDGTTRGAKS
jgi:pyruvate/2-oxoglutarate dehydrogenase complex dihydrolipoamide acyltransferase (E2) component